MAKKRKKPTVKTVTIQANYEPLPEELQFERVSGFFRENPMVPETVLSETNIEKNFTVDNWLKHGIFRLRLPEECELRKKLVLFRQHLNSNFNLTRKYMRKIFNTIALTKKAAAEFAAINARIDKKYAKMQAETEEEQKQLEEQKADEKRWDEGRAQWKFCPSQLKGKDRRDPFYIRAEAFAADIGRDLEMLLCPLLSGTPSLPTPPPSHPFTCLCFPLLPSCLFSSVKTVPTFPIMMTLLETMEPVDDKEVQRQLLHSDQEKPDNGVTTEPEACVGLASMQDGTLFRAMVGSHNSSAPPPLQASIFTLKAGDILVCHPDLIHSGMGASKYNLRLHYYMGLDPDVQRETYIPNFVYGLDLDTAMADARESKKHKTERPGRFKKIVKCII